MEKIVCKVRLGIEFDHSEIVSKAFTFARVTEEAGNADKNGKNNESDQGATRGVFAFIVVASKGTPFPAHQRSINWICQLRDTLCRVGRYFG